MNHRPSFALALLRLGLAIVLPFATTLRAQTAAATGTIAGRVLNADTGAYLENVRVRVVAPLLLAPAHFFGDLVDPVRAVLARFVETQITVHRFVLLAQIAFPIELVPSQVAAFVPLALGAAVRIEVAHSVAAKQRRGGGETQIKIRTPRRGLAGGRGSPVNKNCTLAGGASPLENLNG